MGGLIMNQRITSRLAARLGLNIALDGALAALAVQAAYFLADPASPRPHPAAMPLAAAAAIWLIGIPFGLARLHWRFTAMRDLARIGGAALVTAILLTLLLVGAGVRLPSIGFPAILALCLIVALTTPRLLYRLGREGSSSDAANTTKAILVGTGETAELFISALARSDSAAYRVVGLISLSNRHTGRRIHGHDIISSVAQAEPALARLQKSGTLPDLLIITSPELTGDALAGLLAVAGKYGLRVQRTPTLTALAPADQTSLQLQPIAIEDLLNRRQVVLDRDGMAGLIRGRRVLVTGAGGSIGSELARQVAGLGPAEIMLLDNGEFALWQIDLELAELQPATRRRAVIADVRDRERMLTLCADFRPELVFHAAALKHVPIVEANPLEGLQTNVLGTKAVADAAQASGAALMVLISTDKAVNPSSVMGATKRLAEMVCQGLDIAARHGAAEMRCVTVRFGNVLGSTGSVVPLFRRQLAQGGPLTVTHPDMQRYFMTVREAVGLVLQASVVGSGEAAIEDGGIFVLDMGEPVKIIDLAYQMIRLAGLRPDIDIKVEFTGLRPGEKLFEELFHGSEAPAPTEFPGLLMASPRTADRRVVNNAIQEIAVAAAHGDAAGALTVLARMVPEFVHNADGSEPGLAISAAAR
jgi:FlaA1/EpsC-like NDP-sugar epimerase